MNKYYKRGLTYFEVFENGSYISITPLISQTTVTAGYGFHKSSTETEITELEFRCETNEPMQRFINQCQKTYHEKTI